MKAFIQKKDGEFVNVNAYTAWDGFRQLGMEVIPFETAELAQLSLSKETIVHGNVGVVRRALAALGLPEPNVPGAPPELAPYFGRRIWETTLGVVRKTDFRGFLKPLRASDHKRFTGYVRTNDVADVNRCAHLEDDFPVFCSDVIAFVSEWRAFVLDGACIGARPYAGGYAAPVPDLSIIDTCIEAYTRAPRAYSIDVGWTKDGTRLVEINDAFALGCYGLPSVPYAQMIEARWTEMCQL